MPEGESAVIWGLDSAGKMKQLAEGDVGMIKVLEMAVVILGEENDSIVVLDKLQTEKKALEDKVKKLETTVGV